MRVFETLKLADKVVTFARTAISLLQPDDPLVVRTHPLLITIQNILCAAAVLTFCFVFRPPSKYFDGVASSVTSCLSVRLSVCPSVRLSVCPSPQNVRDFPVNKFGLIYSDDGK